MLSNVHTFEEVCAFTVDNLGLCFVALEQIYCFLMPLRFMEN